MSKIPRFIQVHSQANLEGWAGALALAGLAISAAGTAYGISQSGVDYPSPKKFVPIDTKSVASLAEVTDRTGYGLTDADYKNRYPLLAAGRTAGTEDDQLNIHGGTSPVVSDALASAGVSADLGDNPFKQAFNLGIPILAKEQRDRTYHQRLMSENPMRQFGLSGGDVAHIAIANTGSGNNYNQGVFGSRINAYNAQTAQAAQNTSAIINTAGGIASIGANLWTNPYLNSDYFVDDWRENATNPSIYPVPGGAT